MATTANLNSPNGITVSARNASKYGNRFYCSTENCTVEMFLISEDTDAAHFRTKAHSRHISICCTRNNIVFDTDTYTTEGFSYQTLQECILGTTNPTNIHGRYGGNGSSRIGHGTKTPPRTLKQIYYMLINHNLNSPFGNIPRGADILVCRDNISEYISGFTGLKLCECTFFRYSLDDSALYVDIPSFFSNEHIPAKISFDDLSCLQQINHHILKRPKSTWHNCLFVIAGEWRRSNQSDYLVECQIHSKKQYCFID